MGNKISTCFKPKPPQPKRSSHTLYTISEKEIPPNKLHKIKPFFPSSTKWRCTDPRDFTEISKLRPKLLSHINFVNHRAEITGAKALRNLRRVLTDAKRSTNLSIEDPELSFRQLRYLINSTNHLKKIKLFPLPSNKLSDHHFLESLVRIGRNKNLSELTPSSTQIQLKNPRIAYCIHKQLKSLRKMEHLCLNYYLSWYEFFGILHPIRSLTSIDLVLPASLDFHGELLSNYFSKLSQCNQLEHMHLIFIEDHTMDSKEIQHWNSFFQKTQFLKNLTLIKLFKLSQDLENFKLFLECFKSLNQLTTLRLRLGAPFRQPIEDQQNTFFLCFFTHLKYLTQLQKLEFTIVGEFLLKNIHIEHLALFLQDLKNLQTLELNLPHIESLSEVVISLAKGLQYLSDLKHLKISCRNNQTVSISYKALRIFSSSIAHLQLESLDFPLFDDQLLELNNHTKESLAPLFRALSGFQNLSKLNIDLSALKIFSCEFKTFTLALRSLRKLSSISLVLPQLDHTNNFQDLSSFISCFKVMSSLSSLQLAFAGKNLCDQEVDVIARNLNDCCRQLSRLELVFKHANQLSGDSLDHLQAEFANLQNLEYLKLKIGDEQKFDFDIVCKFLRGLTVLKRLKELSFEGRDIRLPLHTHYPILESVQELYTLKHLTKVVVNGYRYI